MAPGSDPEMCVTTAYLFCDIRPESKWDLADTSKVTTSVSPQKNAQKNTSWLRVITDSATDRPVKSQFLSYILYTMECTIDRL